MKIVGGWDWRNILIERVYNARLKRRYLVAAGLTDDGVSIAVLRWVEAVAFADLCDMGQNLLATQAAQIADEVPLGGHIAESHALWRNAAP